MAAHDFPGTQEELFRLAKAAEHNCSCVPNEFTCSSHALLTNDELTKRLVYIARLAEKLLEEESK